MMDEKKAPVSERVLPILGRSGVEPLLDSHAAAALHFDAFIRTYEGRRVLIETNADRKRIVGEGGDESS